MKLRKKQLRPLTFDPSGAFVPDHGITLQDMQAIYPDLARIRDAMMTTELDMLRGQLPIPDAMQPLDAGFIPLPELLLREYHEKRESSELGRLFRLANQIQLDCDRVVVLGIGGSYMGARALLESCCQPYWNELSRAQRGSRPRMYFEGNNVDNDATQGLLHLLGADQAIHHHDEHGRWALVVISKSGGTLETAIAFRQFLSALQSSCGYHSDLIKRLVIPVTGHDGKLAAMAKDLGCPEVFPVPDGVGGRFSVLSSVGLVPAALLGINVMELLSGAVEMNRHFRETPPEENIVLQFVAANYLMEKMRGTSVRVLSVWSKALESIGLWYDQLMAESLGKEGLGATPLTTVNTRDLHSRHQQHQQGKRDKFFHNVVIEEHRFDALAVGKRPTDPDGLNDLAEKTLPEVMRAAIDGTNQALREDARPTTTLTLPCADELHVGQLFQMLMLATIVEGRLMGINPYGQPGVEGYKKNMNRLLRNPNS